MEIDLFEHALHVARIQFQTQALWPCTWYSGLSHDHQFINKRMLSLVTRGNNHINERKQSRSSSYDDLKGLSRFFSS